MFFAFKRVNKFVQTHCGETWGRTGYDCVHRCHGHFQTITRIGYGEQGSAVENKKADDEYERAECGHLQNENSDQVISLRKSGTIESFSALVKAALWERPNFPVSTIVVCVLIYSFLSRTGASKPRSMGQIRPAKPFHLTCKGTLSIMKK